jgi:hypothetical protein
MHVRIYKGFFGHLFKRLFGHFFLKSAYNRMRRNTRGGMHGKPKSRSRKSLRQILSGVFTPKLSFAASKIRPGKRVSAVSKANKAFASKMFTIKSHKNVIMRNSKRSKKHNSMQQNARRTPSRAAHAKAAANRAEKMAANVVKQAKKNATKIHRNAMNDLTRLMAGL